MRPAPSRYADFVAAGSRSFAEARGALLVAMGVISSPADKPKILLYAAMMAIQNFGFYLMYYPILLACCHQLLLQ